MEKKYILGLDIGISSVGWALLDTKDGEPCKIEDLGVKIFPAAEQPETGKSNNEERRNHRGTRRLIRRKSFRSSRIRYFLSQNNFLEKSDKKLVSEVNEELKEKFQKLSDNYYKNKDTNPFIIRMEGLDRKLTKDELSIILVHYGKNRGYKSNRDEIDNDTGKVKEEIKLNNDLMIKNNYRTISEMFVKDAKYKDKIHNEENNYQMSVTREMVLNDIEKVLDKQIELGVINENFKKEYIDIWSAQRNYAKGPGGNSKYGGDLIAKMTGTCKFTQLPRAPKYAPSTEIFVALTKLVNLKYKTSSSYNYISLNEEEIKTLLNEYINNGTLNIKKIRKLLNDDSIIIKNVEVSYADIIKKYKKEKGIDNKERIDTKSFDNEDDELFEKIKNQLYDDIKIIKEGKIKIFKKAFCNSLGNDKWNYLLDNIEILDEMATILTNYKTEDDVIEYVENNDIIDEIYGETLLQQLKDFTGFKDHNNLSLDLIRKLNNLMKKGMLYNEAMAYLGYNSSDMTVNKEKSDLLIPINKGNEIKNQRVIRSLSETRGIINSIIKKYGMPYKINIETARELAKSRKEKQEIENRQKENFENNEKLKNQILSMFPDNFNDINKISSQDLLKYKLWNEQNNICPYSLEVIKPEELFDNNLVQVDHILPYSRTYDDSYYNKALVKTKCNEEKLNKTPVEWLKGKDIFQEYKNNIKSLNISNRKKDNYLLDKLTPEIENELRSQNLNDTKYITKYITSYIKAYLNVPVVNTVNGSITSKLRTRWGLNNLTHSLQSTSYYLRDVEENNDTRKNRENHLHHIMDACIIAATNTSLIQKVTNYEKYKRFFDNHVETSIDDLLHNGNLIKVDDNDNYADPETGEIIETDSLYDYYYELKKNKQLEKRKDSKMKVLFPLPYKDFDKELKYRIYERDKKRQKELLKDLDNYDESDITKVNPIIPVFSVQKSKGSLHEETGYGIKDFDGEKYQTSRKSVLKIKMSDIENIRKVDGALSNGSKEVCDTLEKWLSGYENGSKAFDAKGYPKDKTGKLIKKIKTYNRYAENKGHKVDTKLFEKSSIRSIVVFKTKEGRLLFTGLDKFDEINLKNNKEYKLTIWDGSTKSEVLTYNEAINKYEEYLRVKKNQMIQLTKDGTKYLCYFIGFTQGKIQISGCLGDEFDIVGKNRLFNKFYSGNQYPITVSTITDIEKVKLTNLGKIE